jgi:hypothetical protein
MYRMKLTGLAHATVWFLLLATPCITATDDADELQKLAGRYERSFSNNAGTMFRAVKEIEGNQEIVTIFDDVGNVVAAHTATIKAEKHGPVRVFSFFNRIVLAGPNKGETQFATVSYVYRADQDGFIEARGVMDGDPSSPGMLLWKRVKDRKPEPK